MKLENVVLDSSTFTNSRRRGIHIFGAGGVGGNLFATVMENLENFSCKIYDYDTIEPHNLNRSYVFPMASIGEPKVKVLEDIGRLSRLSFDTTKHAAISSRGGSVKSQNLYPTIPQFLRFNELYTNRNEGSQVLAPFDTIPKIIGYNARVTRENFNSSKNMGVFIDARDSTDPNIVIDRTYVKLAYNGGSKLSFTFGPAFLRHCIGRNNNSYEVVPSFFIPAALLAEFTFFFLLYISPKKITPTRANIYKIDIDDECKEIMYDCSDLYGETA
jgi:hypothetical protein